MTQDTVVKLIQPAEFSDPLTEVLREGARALLAQAVEAEVAAFLSGHANTHTEDGRQRLVRHGHRPERAIMTGLGPVAVRAPRVRDRTGAGESRIRFTSAILPPYARRSKSLEVLIPILYLKGISSGDFEDALAALLGPDAGGLSASSIARLKEAWSDEHARWSKRDLSAKRYVYFWVDGIHVQARLEADAQCLLVIIGATPEGKKELVGLTDGVRESVQSWRELLLDLRRRGLSIGPELAVADGALGFWQALEEVWPKTRGQRCWIRPEQASEEPASESQTRAAGHLDGRDQKGCAGRLRRLRRDLRGQVRQGGRVPGEGPRRAARLLRRPRRALETLTDHEPDREHVRDDPPSHGAREGLPVEQDRARHGLQAGPGRREELATARRSSPLAEGDPRYLVHQWDRGRQPRRSTRCRLTPPVTNFRQYLRPKLREAQSRCNRGLELHQVITRRIRCVQAIISELFYPRNAGRWEALRHHVQAHLSLCTIEHHRSQLGLRSSYRQGWYPQ